MYFNPLFLSSTWFVNESLHEFLAIGVTFVATVLEFMGLIVITVAGVKAFMGWVKKDPTIKLHLAESLATALEFKLGGEILKTVVIHDLSEILLVGGIIVLRIALTLLIHWEIENEIKHEKEHALEKSHE